MPVSRKDPRGTRAFAIPLFGVALLLVCYWLLTDWQNVPAMMNALLGAMQ